MHTRRRSIVDDCVLLGGAILLRLMKLAASCVLALGLLACATKVKQANAPRADEFAESGDSDMAAAPEKGPAPIIKNADELRNSCCKQCASGLAEDKKGDDPTKVPCSDYTWVLKEECLNYFRKTPMTAAEAKSCATTTAAKAPAKNASEE